MPRRADGRGSAAATQKRTAAGRFIRSGDAQRRQHDAETFEELAFQTIKCLHPSLRFRRADLRMDRIRLLIERVLRGERPTPQPIVVKAEPTAPKPKPRPPRRRPVESNGAAIARCRSKRVAAVAAAPNDERRRKANGVAKSKRRDSTTATEDEEAEDFKPKSQLELLVERSLAELNSAASFGVVRRELHRLVPSAPLPSRHSSLDQQILHLLDAEPLRCRIEPNRVAAKNIQCVELQILIELHKIQLGSRSLDETAVFPKLRYLQVITGYAHMHRFLNRIVDQEFGSALPLQLDAIKERMCIELASSSPSTASDVLPNGGADVNGNTKPFESFASTSAADSPPSLESTPRQRSNTSSSAVSSASTFEGSANGGEENRQLNAEKRQQSVDSAHSTLSSFTKRTVSTDEEPPQLSGPEDRAEAEEEEEGAEDEAQPPKLTALRRRSSTQSSTVSRAEQRATKRSEYKASARGSIASRRQTNKRLCVIRQNSNGLIQPTSRRSSTASLLLQQQQLGVSLRKRVLTAGILKSSESRDSTPIPAKKPKAEPNVSTEVEKKKRRKTEDVLTAAVLKRYRNRMSDIREQAKDASEHEVFYGRCNERQALFEFTEEPAPSAKPSKTKQKNRSGRSVKKANADCLYIAHWLLNVHNADPLAPGRPRVSATLAGNTFYGGYKPKRNDAPFRVKKLLRHANRAKVLELRRYVQRTQLMEKLKKEKEAAAAAAAALEAV